MAVVEEEGGGREEVYCCHAPSSAIELVLDWLFRLFDTFDFPDFDLILCPQDQFRPSAVNNQKEDC